MQVLEWYIGVRYARIGHIVCKPAVPIPWSADTAIAVRIAVYVEATDAAGTTFAAAAAVGNTKHRF